ncbi:hypothetical protein [Salsuginibacillus halophilus]|uniref:hypothetical protein n=1 Tax=Salsuginibacillus halophilus TaxID=517424 RepID=UPI000D0CB039|nr:hypothetical protein [Salsuginibacillus halophilus]
MNERWSANATSDVIVFGRDLSPLSSEPTATQKSPAGGLAQVCFIALTGRGTGTEIIKQFNGEGGVIPQQHKNHTSCGLVQVRFTTLTGRGDWFKYALLH